MKEAQLFYTVKKNTKFAFKYLKMPAFQSYLELLSNVLETIFNSIRGGGEI